MDAYFAKYFALIQKAYGGQETLYVEVIDRLFNFKKIAVNVPRIGASPGQANGISYVVPYVISPDYPDWLKKARNKDSTLQRVSFSVSASSATYERRTAVESRPRCFMVIQAAHAEVLNLLERIL